MNGWMDERIRGDLVVADTTYKIEKSLRLSEGLSWGSGGSKLCRQA